MNTEQKRERNEIIAGVALLAAAWAAARFLSLPQWAELIVFLVPYLFIGWETLREAFFGVIHGQVFDENFLMAVATLGAIATHEYPEAVFVMLFYRVGELFESVAVGKSRDSISGLMDIMPEFANVEENGELLQKDPAEVPTGSIIVVKPGEKVPLDGVVAEGHSSLNTMALTGESAPMDADVGDKVISGCINLSGLLRVKTTCEYSDSTVARILDLVENSAQSKTKSENFITRFARYYTPAVVLGALLLALVPPLFVGNWQMWIYRGLTFLVISCPCALVISVPLTFFGGIGKASRRGILVKGSNYLEALAAGETVVFDKTGTLTHGSFSVTRVNATGMPEEELMYYAAAAEHYSDHPIALSIKEAYKGELDASKIGAPEELSGMGVRVEVNGKTVLAGNRRLMQSANIACEDDAVETTVHIAVEGKYAGSIAIADQIKEDSAEAVAKLKALGVKKTVMLTGDKQAVGEKVAAAIGIDEVHAGLLPADKVDWVERLIGEKTKRGKLVYVGDGINDAPVLTRADVGVAMGALGSDAAIEAADVVIMDDKPSRIPEAVGIARQTKRIVTQNIVMALLVKAVIMALGATGLAGMWAAVFADVGVMVLAVLNAMRMLG